ncbi:MAG: serine hydrolase [Flavobacteriales bacterium]|nr:serine hydrolase [Flavobacteriales bacterium]
MLRTKVPAYVPLISLLLGSGAMLALGFVGKEKEQPTTTHSARVCDVTYQRVRGYNSIKPLLSTEHECESERYAGLKHAIGSYLEQEKNSGTISEAGFYLRDFRKAEWTMYNGDVQFEPGSLMKVPFLMTYLRMAEKDPTVMARSYRMPAGTPEPKAVHFPPTSSMEPDKPYSVAELLKLAIIHSDNQAVNVLLKNIDITMLHRTFTELGLPDMKGSDTRYPLSPKAFSVFMKAIYNGTYLSLDDSELAVSLLMASEFGQGLKAGLPPGTRIAHKFGESFGGQDWQLHETALIYIGADPYLITVMTQGPRMEALPAVLANVSKLAYDEMVRLNGAVQ